MAKPLFNESEVVKRETYEINGRKYHAVILYDASPENPKNEFDFIGTMIQPNHRGKLEATIGDGPGFYFDDEDEFLRWAKKNRFEVTQGYDGQFWYVTTEEIQRYWGIFPINKRRKTARESLEIQAKTVKAFQDGEVFGFIVTDETETDNIFSSFGWYGRDQFSSMFQQAKEEAEYYANDPTNRRFILCYFNGVAPIIEENQTFAHVCEISQGGRTAEEIAEEIQKMEFGQCVEFLECGPIDSIIVKRSK